MDLQTLPFLLVPVAEDDGIVHRQGQLQHDAHGIGDEGDGPQQEVGADVDDGGHQEGEDHDRDLRKGAGGEDQHRQHNDHHKDQHRPHLLSQQGGQAEADRGMPGHIIARQALEYRGQCALAAFGLLDVGKGDVKQRRAVLIVLFAPVEQDKKHVGDLAQLLFQRFRLPGGDVSDHHLGCAVGGEFVHDLKALPRLRLFRQIEGDVVFHLDPPDRKNGEHNQRKKSYRDRNAQLYNEFSDVRYRFFPFRFHLRPPFWKQTAQALNPDFPRQRRSTRTSPACRSGEPP